MGSDHLKQPVLSDDVIQAMVRAGWLTSGAGIRRVVLDLESGSLAKLHVEYVADKTWMQVIQSLDGIQIVVYPHDPRGEEVDNTRR